MCVYIYSTHTHIYIYIYIYICIYTHTHTYTHTYTGRPLTAQISVVVGTLVYLTVFLGPFPHGPEAFNTLVFLFALFGLTATWAGVGCNLPILLDLVDARSRARIAGLF